MTLVHGPAAHGLQCLGRQRLHYLAALLVSIHAGTVNLKSRCPPMHWTGQTRQLTPLHF